jgi:transcriptional regulator with XRE-family HTH domain
MPVSQFSDSYKAFIAALVEARVDAGVSQKEVAERMGDGWDQPSVSKIERGVRRLDVIEFSTFASAMGYDPGALYTRLIRGAVKPLKKVR